MALLRDRVFKRPLRLLELINLEKSKVNLKPLNRVTVRFDPFRNDTADIRKFTSLLHSQDTVKTNPKCIIKTEILTNREEQTITFDLTDGKQFIFKCANLKCLEIFKLMNEHITPLAPPEEDAATLQVPVKKGKKK